MAYNTSTGAYTTPTGAETATTGQTIASATWNAINTDYAAAFNAITGSSGQVTFVSLLTGGPVSTGAPVVISSVSTTTVGATTGSLIILTSSVSTCFLTLPAASTYPGRWLYIKQGASPACSVSSNSSNVVLLGATAAQTVIISVSTSGQWANIQSDGTNWQVMARGNNQPPA